MQDQPEPSAGKAVDAALQSVEGEILHRLIGKVLHRVAADCGAAGPQAALDGDAPGPCGGNDAVLDAKTLVAQGEGKRSAQLGLYMNLAGEIRCGKQRSEIDFGKREDAGDCSPAERDRERIDLCRSPGHLRACGAELDSARGHAEARGNAAQWGDPFDALDRKRLIGRGLERKQRAERNVRARA